MATFLPQAGVIAIGGGLVLVEAAALPLLGVAAVVAAGCWAVVRLRDRKVVEVYDEAESMILDDAFGKPRSPEEIAGDDSMPSKLREKVLEEAKLDKKGDDKREPTPATFPHLFVKQQGYWVKETRRAVGKKLKLQHITSKDGEVWAFDTLHGNEFEVYASMRHYKSGDRTRAVTWDGKLKKVF